MKTGTVVQIMNPQRADVSVVARLAETPGELAARLPIVFKEDVDPGLGPEVWAALTVDGIPCVISESTGADDTHRETLLWATDPKLSPKIVEGLGTLAKWEAIDERPGGRSTR